MGIFLIGVAMVAASLQAYPSVSVYSRRLEDPQAVYVRAAANDLADSTTVIQQAIDRVQETHGSGIVFLESGRYRITDTLRVWPGVRIIGYGPTRPSLVLPPRTPGYLGHEKFMVFFAGRRPRGGQAMDLDHPRMNGLSLDFAGDATPGTFYSAMDNVDLEIGEGNPMAVGVRSRYAQHCYLAHMDFHLGSALAGIHDAGNVAFDLRFFGGQSGIITRTPSPGWQFTLLDSVFDGQSGPAIRTYETGLTLIRPTFRHVPNAVSVEPNHSEMLWMSDARLEDISGPAIVISREKALRTQINTENIACQSVPIFAELRESRRLLRGKGNAYIVKSLLHGPSGSFENDEGHVVTRFDAKSVHALPREVPTDIRTLPDAGAWVSIADLGAKGDGEFDNTAILQAAIDKDRSIYLPQGRYRVTKPIRLRPHTVLIGLHPFTTQILIKDGTRAFGAIANTGTRSGLNLAPLIYAPQGGDNIVSGIGLDTGGNNRSATAAIWMAGKHSMLNDVKFLGGHGSVPWNQIYNADHSADPNPSRHWDSQYPSLWVTNGGGGTFLNIWPASTFAKAGMLVSNTSTEGKVYELSSEHHVHNEIVFQNASHWRIYSLQTEEEWGEGPKAVPVDIDSCTDIQLANTVIYRVIGMKAPHKFAIRIAKSKDIRLQNVHCNSNSKVSFDNLVLDGDAGNTYRTREVADFAVRSPQIRHRGTSERIEKIAGGFAGISGGAVDSKGNFYFVMSPTHQIYCLETGQHEAKLIREEPLQPVNLFFDDLDNMVAVCYSGNGTVISYEPGGRAITSLEVVPLWHGKTYVLPVSDFELNMDMVQGKTKVWSSAFPALDGNTVLPVDQGFLTGALSWGVKAESVIRSFGLAKAKPGDTFYVSGENNLRTYSAKVEPDGSLSHPKLFAEQGGEGVAVDAKGNVYLAAGQIYVYNPAGMQIRTIRVPERPIQLVFGGPDRKTLLIVARTSVYSMRTP